MKIGVKELMETSICLKVIKKKEMTKLIQRLENISQEKEELIAIFAKSIETAKKNKATKN